MREIPPDRINNENKGRKNSCAPPRHMRPILPGFPEQLLPTLRKSYVSISSLRSLNAPEWMRTVDVSQVKEELPRVTETGREWKRN